MGILECCAPKSLGEDLVLSKGLLGGNSSLGIPFFRINELFHCKIMLRAAHSNKTFNK